MTNYLIPDAGVLKTESGDTILNPGTQYSIQNCRLTRKEQIENFCLSMEAAMARMARVVVPGWAHHVTQRGNRRQQTFFCDADYVLYLKLMAEFFAKAETEVWGYCLMPNHVHIIAAPKTKEGLRAALAETHRRYTRVINRREKWTGYLWQGRFASFPMDNDYFLTCSRYVGLNPVRAMLTTRAADWPWSSVGAHLRGADDAVVRVKPLLTRVNDAAAFFATDLAEEGRRKLRRASATGRPLGAAQWVKALEAQTGRALLPQTPGRKPLARGGVSSADTSRALPPKRAHPPSSPHPNPPPSMRDHPPTPATAAIR